MFNGFSINEYLKNKHIKQVSLHELLDGFDSATNDPIYCAVVVTLVLTFDKQYESFKFAYQNSAFEYYYQKALMN